MHEIMAGAVLTMMRYNKKRIIVGASKDHLAPGLSREYNTIIIFCGAELIRLFFIGQNLVPRTSYILYIKVYKFTINTKPKFGHRL